MADLLVDTHVLLWHLLDDPRLPETTLDAVAEAPFAVYASTASLWEIAIKRALGKLEAPDDLPRRLRDLGFRFLDVTPEHAWAVRDLPRHHGDPFDRLLVAQAQTERLSLVSADPRLHAYDVPVVWSGGPDSAASADG
jgi:PIN domain nuclease of toxin-antitoxin system